MQFSEHPNINIYSLAVYFRSQDYVDKNYYSNFSNDKDIGKNKASKTLYFPTDAQICNSYIELKLLKNILKYLKCSNMFRITRDPKHVGAF